MNDIIEAFKVGIIDREEARTMLKMGGFMPSPNLATATANPRMFGGGICGSRSPKMAAGYEDAIQQKAQAGHYFDGSIR